MSPCIRRHSRRDLGMVLITSLLLLLVVTLLALAMFRGAGLENRIAGNVLDKQRALQAATSTDVYAEQWLVNNVSAATQVSCTATTFSGATAPPICTNTLASATGETALNVPWSIGGYSYNPTTTLTGATTLFPVATSDLPANYYGSPTFYIAYLGYDATYNYLDAKDYQIDAWSYGGSNSTVAVVESIYQIRPIAAGGGGP